MKKSFGLQASQLPAVLFLTGTNQGTQMVPGNAFNHHHLRALTQAARDVANTQGLGPNTPWRQQQSAMAEGLTTGLLVSNGTVSAGDFVLPEMQGVLGLQPFQAPSAPGFGGADLQQVDRAEERRRAEDLDRLERETLRHNQQEEFRMAQAADRQREEAEIAQQEEEALRDAIEMSLQGEQERLAKEKKRTVKDMRDALGPDPTPGPGIIKISFKGMPQGVTSVRNFSSEDPISKLFDFVDVQLECRGEFELKLSYPNTPLVREECTLASKGMVRNSMLMVSMRDEEDGDSSEGDDD